MKLVTSQSLLSHGRVAELSECAKLQTSPKIVYFVRVLLSPMPLVHLVLHISLFVAGFLSALLGNKHLWRAARPTALRRRCSLQLTFSKLTGGSRSLCQVNFVVLSGQSRTESMYIHINVSMCVCVCGCVYMYASICI